MWFARYIITEAARRLILDPEFRDRAADTCRRAAPRVAAISRTVSESVSKTVKDSPPVKDPAGFGRAAGKRVGAVIRRFRADSRTE